MSVYFRVLVFAGAIFSFSFQVMASEVSDFLIKNQVRTYDCPNDRDMPTVENFLSSKNLSVSEESGLRVFKSHWLICVGKNDQAQEMLNQMVEANIIDKTSRHYANLLYQLGYIYDVNSDPLSCDYYQQSENISKDKFNDIYLSSQLGLITVCDQNKQDIGVKLGRMFSMVKTYSNKDDIPSLAHIHNNIGLLYSSIGQMALAAEQYEKTYRLGLNVYEDKNALAPIISVISAYTGSGDLDKAALMIEELRLGNLKVNTPLTNNWYHYAQSRQYYRTEDYESMRKSMLSWKVFLDKISNKTLVKLYDWYQAALCLHDKDKACVNNFLTRLENESNQFPSRIKKHIHFIRFLVKAHLFLGDLKSAEKIFDSYAETVSKKEKSQQDSAKILGVANLHNEIIALEESLTTAEQKRIQTIIVILLLVAFLAGLIYLTIGRNYLKILSTDKLTGLQNEQSVLAAIKQVKAPVTGKVNALALFDVTNFFEVDVQFGYVAGESLLIKVARCLSDSTRDKDIVGRIGSDQFIVCLKSIEEKNANELFEHILCSLTHLEIKSSSGKSIKIQSSMNIYSSIGSFSDLDDVLTDIRALLRKKSTNKE